MLILSADQLAAIESHAEQTYPDECCGLMLGTLKQDGSVSHKVVKQLVALENQWTPDRLAKRKAADRAAQSKRRRYWIDPKDMLRSQKSAREQGLNIIGVYHSHPDHVAVPSECDRALAWPEYAYVIVSVKKAKAVDTQNWALDAAHQFQPDPIKVVLSTAQGRMPIST